MAPTTREIPRSEWRSYFDDFSRNLGAMTATVEVDGEDVGAQVESAGARLDGITYDDGDDIVVIGLEAPGDGHEDLERIVYAPQAIFVASGEDEATVVFDIEDAEKHKTLLRLEPAH